MSSRPDSFMPLWIADYLADTQHLTCEQHGAYLLLLIAYWRRQGPLPDDNIRLAAICKVGHQKWRSLRTVLAEFFVAEGGALKNKRADEEIVKAAALHAKKVAAGRKGAEIRYSVRSSAIADGVADGVADAQQNASISHLTSHLPTDSQSPMEPLLVRVEQRELDETQRTQSKPPSSKTIRGRRWGASETVPPDWIEAGAELRQTHGLAPVDLKLLAVDFENYWASAAGKYAVKVDWRRTWLNRVTSVKANGGLPNGRTSGTGQHGRASEVASVFVENYLAARAEREAARS